MDEWIEFPEELDVGPFVMPRKEDFEEKRRGEKVGREGEFVYRLYAVVVHIGNMVSGLWMWFCVEMGLTGGFAAWWTLYCVYGVAV